MDENVMDDREKIIYINQDLRELYDERSSLAEIVLEFLEENPKASFIKSAVTKRNQIDREIDKINKKLFYNG